MKNSPGPRPRLYGAFADKPPASKVVLECTKLDLIELAENAIKRRQVILSQITVMFSRDDDGCYVSETESSARPRSALRVPLPAASPLTQTGGLLQLQRSQPSPSPTDRNYATTDAATQGTTDTTGGDKTAVGPDRPIGLARPTSSSRRSRGRPACSGLTSCSQLRRSETETSLRSSRLTRRSTISVPTSA